MNTLILAGHLGADPEVRFTPSGRKVTSLRLATKTRRSGEDETVWWQISVWGDQFDKMITLLKKGSGIVVTGSLAGKPRIFTGKDNQPQVSLAVNATDLQFSPFGRPDQGAGQTSNPAQHYAASAAPSMTYGGTQEHSVYGAGKEDAAFSDDDIPF